MNISIKNCAKLIMRSGKRYMTEGIEIPNQEKSEGSEKWKIKNTWEYWRRTPSDKWIWKKKKNTWEYWKRTPLVKWRWKKKIKKRISGEVEKKEKI